MKKLIFFLFFWLIATLNFAQSKDSCAILRMIFEKMIKNEYARCYVSNITNSLDIGSEDYFSGKLKGVIDQKSLQQIIAASKNNKHRPIIDCFEDSILCDKDSVINILSNKRLAINSDTFFVKFVEQRHKEILKNQNFAERESMLRELTATKEFDLYTNYIDYNTPRLIEFSTPIFKNGYCVLMIDVRKNRGKDWGYSLLVLCKKQKNGWRIVYGSSF